jgi:hypothetical protein
MACFSVVDGGLVIWVRTLESFLLILPKRERIMSSPDPSLIFPRRHSDRQWHRSLKTPVELRPYGPGDLMDITMPRLIVEILNHLKAELILYMKMDALRNHRGGCKVHRVSSLVQQ